MADIKWIQLSIDIFNNRKIKQIRKMPDGDAIVGIWLQILCIAGQINDCGAVYFTKDVPYTEDMLAAELDRPISTIRLALITFQKFNMLEIVDNILLVSNWEKYQSADKLEKIKEQDRLRKRKQRALQTKKIEELPKCHVTSHGDVTQCHATELELELELELDKEDTTENNPTAVEVQNLYNSICISFPKVKSLSDMRKKTIKARLNTYSLDDFKKLFEKAEASDFLKGKNDRSWIATFDWLIKDANIAKVLDGNYDNKQAIKKTVKNYGTVL